MLTGLRTGVTYLTNEQPNSIEWRDVEARDVFKDPEQEASLGPTCFLTYAGDEWMQRVNVWARDNNFVAAMPTGWFANQAGKWVVGLVLFHKNAAHLIDVPGDELFVDEKCAKEVGSAGTGEQPLPGNFLDTHPFGTQLFVGPAERRYWRCLATSAGEATFALFERVQTGSPSSARMVLTPRTDTRTRLFFANETGGGAWLVGHELNAAETASEGEKERFYLPGGLASKQERFAFETTRGFTQGGARRIHSVGFVKQGVLGIARPIMSFTWSTFINLSPGMNISLILTA
jgi:hypothetical protein